MKQYPLCYMDFREIFCYNMTQVSKGHSYVTVSFIIYDIGNTAVTYQWEYGTFATHNVRR